MAWRGQAVVVGHDVAGIGPAGSGVAVEFWQGRAWSGGARHGARRQRRGAARRSRIGALRLGKSGRGLARFGGRDRD